jgi:hypothetical protein
LIGLLLKFFRSCRDPRSAFSFRNGTFWRDLQSGVRHVVIIDLDTRAKKTFRVILGFNALQIAGDRTPDEAGIFAVQYLSHAGVSGRPTNFPCGDGVFARRSLVVVRQALLEFGIPWLSRVHTLRQCADLVEDHYPAVKGQLLLCEGLVDEAGFLLEKHRDYLRAHGYAETEPAWIETERLIAQCKASASGL